MLSRLSRGLGLLALAILPLSLPRPNLAAEEPQDETAQGEANPGEADRPKEGET
jgi:hypothetical protein